MTLEALPYVVLLGVLFGSTLVASRFGVGQFAPMTYVGLRLALAGLAHLFFYLRPGRGRAWPRDRQLWRHAIVLGIFGTAIPMTSVVSSLAYQSSGVTSLLLTANPALTVLLAHFFLADERLNRRKGLGISLALGGALLLAIRGESGLPTIDRASPIGYGLVLLAMVCGSVMTIYARKYMRQFNEIDVASIRLWAATLTVLPLSLLLVGFDLSAVTTGGYLVLLYAAAVGTFAGLLLAFYNIKRFGATAAALASYVIPVVAGIGGTLFLGEHITSGMLAGMALIILGIALLNERSPVMARPLP
ncbi:MAG: DMT family transporter [Anaerolineales bacterium]|nr:DMT family transporter [Anaerolineales bacterium]